MNALTEDIKEEEVKEEEATETTEEVVEETKEATETTEEVVEGTKEATETTEEVVEETKETSELEEAQARAEEFENKEERQQLQKYRSQDLAKAILPSLDNIERALAVEGLTDDVKKGLEMIQESLINGLKEEGIEEIAADGEFDHNFHMAIQTMPADDEHPADTIAQVFQKGYKLHDRILRPAMVVVYKEN